MLTNLRRSLVLCAVCFALLGLAYPLAETVLAQAAFHYQANGSLGPAGSTLVGQTWRGPRWFQGRPDSDNPMSSGGANLGPRSKALLGAVSGQASLLRGQGIQPTPDLVTTSGSGIDPDISPAGAYAQAPAVARARGLPLAEVLRLVAAQVKGPQWGFLGSSYVNVLELNEALSRLP